MLRTIPNVVFQQDGAPPHWGPRVREALDRVFRDKWIGRGGPIAWPARRSDITPLDFFFWGFLKDRVFQEPVDELECLKERIKNVDRQVNRQLLSNTWKELHKRLVWLKDNNGKHYEVFR